MNRKTEIRKTGFGRREGFVQRGEGMNIEIIHH
jgi:hypothetical protein